MHYSAARMARCHGKGAGTPRVVHDHEGLGPIPPGERPSASRSSRSFAVAPFCCPCGSAVRPDGGALEESHAEADALLLHEAERSFPDPEAGPADEDLGGHPARTLRLRESPPLHSVVVPPKDRADGPLQVLGLHLRVRAAGLDQWLQHRPLLVCQRHPALHKPEECHDLAKDSGTKKT